MKVQKTTLLLIASIVWIFAGFNILKIGLQEYPPYIHWYTIAISIVVFCVFQWFVFGKLVQKHTQRILDYIQEKQFVLKFFDAKSYIIMAVMMIGGIMIRTFHWLPSSFIAVFYTGLGASLFWAGLLFGCSSGKAIVQKKRKGDLT